MGRPMTSLLERCLHGSFRPRHHWSLLATEPDLPVPAMAELQQRARVADEPDVRALARDLAKRLCALTELERSQLEAARAETDQVGRQQSISFGPDAISSGPEDAEARTPRFRQALEAALAMLLQHADSELTASERFQFELLVSAVDRLDAVRSQIAGDGLMIVGSRGQERAHPLLALERELSRELGERLSHFESRVARRADGERLMSGGFDSLFPSLAQDCRPSSAGLSATTNGTTGHRFTDRQTLPTEADLRSELSEAEPR
jgi:hypothetical protein